MAPSFDIWRVDSVGFLDRVDADVKARTECAAIKRSKGARNGKVYVALRSELTKRRRDNRGSLVSPS